MAFYQYNFPTRIQYGRGAIGLLPAALKEAGVARPLIVTDRGLASLRPIVGTRKLLADADLTPAVFSGIWGNPVKAQVGSGVEAFRAHDADAIVAHVAKSAQGGEIVVVFSNGGFGGIHDKLLERLGRR